MATAVWKGDAAAVAQKTVCTIGGTVDAAQRFIVTIGSKSLMVVAGATTAAGAVANIVSAWNALTASAYPEFAAITISDNLNGSFTLSGTAGVPFVVALSTTEGDGSPSTSETFTQTTLTSATGPAFWSEPTNWSTQSVPTSGDSVVIQNSAAPILYGLDQQTITLSSLRIDQSFSGAIGLPRNNPAGYVEYRGTYLQIKATSIVIGGGSGGGSGRIKLDTGSAQTTLNLLNSGSPTESLTKAVVWRGTHASNAVNVNKGSFGAAVFAGEVATIATLKQGFRTNVAGDSDVELGSGCTLSAIVKTGGTLVANASFSSLNQSGGETVLAAGTPGSLTVTGGAVRYQTPGTYTQATVSRGGELDFRQDMQPRVGTNTTLHAGATLRDPAKTVTFTNPIVLTCQLSDVTLDLGDTFNLQRS